MRRNNYEIMTRQSQALFAKQDMDALALRHNLRQADGDLLVPFCGKTYRLRRADARLSGEDGREAEFHTALSIYDLLNHEQTAPVTGRWCTVNALPHTLRSGSAAGPALSDGSTRLTRAQFCAGCETIGAPYPTKADVSYQIPVFGKLSVLLQYWEADDEFSAKLQSLWDYNAQSFVLYETMYYILGHLYRQFGWEV